MCKKAIFVLVTIAIVLLTLSIALAAPPAFTVRFLDWKGDVISEEQVIPGGNATAPNVPAREHYNHTGWDTSFTNVSSDKDVKALYTPIQYNITYMLGGGTNDPRNPTTYTIEDTPLWFYAPTRSGYECHGWKLNTSDTIFTYKIDGDLVGDITLYAQWSATGGGVQSFNDGKFQFIIGKTTNNNNPDTYWYIIIKDTDDGHIIDSIIGLHLPPGSGTDIPLEGGGYEVLVTYQGNSIRLLKFIKVRVSYQPGTWGSFPEEIHPVLLNAPTPPEPVNYNVPRVPGYLFAGWQPTRSPIVTGGVTYVAQWVIRSGYIVHYDTGGGAPIADLEGVAWDQYNLLPTDDPMRAGFEFDGWYQDSGFSGDKVENSIKYSDLAHNQDNILEVTIYAKWTEKENYVVKYDTDGGTPPTIDNLEDVKWTQTDLLPPIIPTKTGYTFEGWYTDLNGGGYKVTNDIAYSTLADDDDTVMSVEIYAYWKVKDTYTVHYNTDGGSTFSDKEYVEWTETSLLPDDPIKTGYIFDGWYSESNGAGYEVTNSTAYSTLANDDDELMEVTIYAKWIDKSHYTVHFDTDGGSLVDDLTGVKWTRTHLLPSVNPVKAGYIFDGWYTAINGGGSSVTDSTAYSTLANGDDTVLDVTIYAKWVEKDEYTVHYNTDGGSLIADLEDVSWTQTDLLPPIDPVKTGYTFDDWYTELNGGGNLVDEDTAYSTLANDVDTVMAITIYANWIEKNGYTVHYNTDGGSLIVDLEDVTWTQTDLLPSIDPTKTGYTFDGWYTAINGGGYEVTDLIAYSTLANGNDTVMVVTIYAKWVEKDIYTVHYNTDGGSPIADLEEVKWTQTDLLPSDDPVKIGYTFDGWYTEINGGGDLVDDETAYSSLADDDDTVLEVTIYAKWSVKDSYTVHYNTDGGSSIADKTYVFWTQTNLLPPTNPTKEGYNFGGWFTAINGGGTTVTNSTAYSTLANGVDTVMEVTIYAFWTLKGDYTVHYNTDGGTLIDDLEEVSWTQTNLLPPVPPTKTGYNFDGWYTEINGGGALVENSTAYSTLADGDDTMMAVTIYAKWAEKDGYTIHYNTDGGSLIGDLEDVSWTQTDLLPPIDPTKTGYTFDGWYTAINGGGYEVTDSIAYSTLANNIDTTMAVTIYAKWVEKNIYTVHYNTDGGSPIADLEEVKWTQTDLLPSDDPVKIGYTFDGWYTEINGGGDLVDDETAYSVLANGDDTVLDVTVYAKWIEKDGYTVHYNTDGGSLIDSLTEVSWTQTNLLPPSNPTKEGYIFNGWFTAINGGGAPVTNGTAYSTLANGNDTVIEVTIYAHWTLKGDYTVHYNTDGGTLIADLTDVSWTQSNLLPLTPPIKSGYIFDGWYTEIDGGGDRVSNDTVYSTLANDDDAKMEVTIFAKWVMDPSQIRPIAYMVEYYQDGGEKPVQAFPYLTHVWINDLTAPLIEPVDISNSRYIGYVLDYYSPDPIPEEVSDGDVISVYYVKDLNQTKTLSYTVEYHREGEDVITLPAITETVWINAPEMLTVLPVDKSNTKYFGYRFDKTDPDVIPEQIASGSVIKVYYVSRNDFSYKVEYREGSVDGAKLREDVFKGNITYREEIVETAKVIPGYTPTENTITKIIDEENIVLVFVYNANDVDEPVRLTVKKDLYDADGALIENSEQVFHIVIRSEDETFEKHIFLKPGESQTIDAPKNAVLTIKEEKAGLSEDYRLEEILTYNNNDKENRKATVVGDTLLGQINLNGATFGNVSVIGSLISEGKDDKELPDKGVIWVSKHVYQYGLLVESDSVIFTVQVAGADKVETAQTTHNGPPAVFTVEVDAEYDITEPAATLSRYYELIGIYDADNPDVNIDNRKVLTVRLTANDINGKTVLVINSKYPQYTVRYNTDGGTFIPDKTGVLWVDSGLLPGINPTKAGFVFDGFWYTEPNKKGQKIGNDKEYRQLPGVNESMMVYTLYAGWNAYNPPPPPPPPPGGGTGGTSNPNTGIAPTPTPTPVIIPDEKPPQAPVFISDHVAYIIGYPEGDVRPERLISRAEVATVFYRLLTEDMRKEFWSLDNPFPDVAPDSWYNAAVSVMTSMGVIRGYDDGTFRPDNNITRGELAAISARFARQMGMRGRNKVEFSDISGHWANDDILLAAKIGWVRGYPDGSFRPDNSITRAEFITLANNVLGRVPETVGDLLADRMKKWNDNANTDEWYYIAIQEATNSHNYASKEGGNIPGKLFKYERWTGMMQNPDWIQLEKGWIAEYSAK